MSIATLTRDALIPRSPDGTGRGLGLALLVHALLVVAIAFGVHWRASTPVGVDIVGSIGSTSQGTLRAGASSTMRSMRTVAGRKYSKSEVSMTAACSRARPGKPPGNSTSRSALEKSGMPFSTTTIFTPGNRPDTR